MIANKPLKISTMKRTYSILLLLMIIGICNQAKAETYLLDLDKSISIAKLKSLQMLSLKQDLKISEYNLRSATSRFKTHVDMDLVSPNYTETVRQFEDSTGITFYSIRQSMYSGNLTINQPLPTDGNIYVTSG